MRLKEEGPQGLVPDSSNPAAGSAWSKRKRARSPSWPFSLHHPPPPKDRPSKRKSIILGGVGEGGRGRMQLHESWIMMIYLVFLIELQGTFRDIAA